MSDDSTTSPFDTTQVEDTPPLQDVHLLELLLAAEDNDWDSSSIEILFTDDDRSHGTPDIEPEPVSLTTTGQPLPPPPTMATTNVVVGGFTFKQRTTKQAAQPAHILQVLHKKEDRASLPKDELFALQEKLTKDQGKKKFTVLPLALDNQDKLEDTYNLAVLIRTTRAHLTKFDTHDVFTRFVVDDADDSKILSTQNLFESYTTVTASSVGKSIKWMREWLSDPWIEENLMFTYSYFENNTEPELWSQVMESYELFPAAEQGGPLFFVLMMQTLLSCTEEASATLITRLRNFKITSLKGENITTYISLMRSAVKRLEYSDRLPEHIHKIVLQGLQTSSVDAFNETFRLIEKQQKKESVLQTAGDKVKLLSLEDLFKMAQSEFVEMSEDNTWTGVTNPGTGVGQSVFLAGQTRGNSCFNCGGAHNVQTCPQPKDETRIKANREKYLHSRDSKKQDSKSSGKPAKSGSGKPKKKWKWSPPAGSENGRRTIDGTPHVYDKSSRHWNPAEAASSTGSSGPSTSNPKALLTSAPAPAPAEAVSSAPAAPSAAITKSKETSDKEARLSVALANVSKSINTSLAGLADQFMVED